MRDLNECREALNAIDDQMKELFLKRKEIVLEVAEYKKEHALPVFDGSREEAMKKRLSADLSQEDAQDYLAFLGALLVISKDIQRRKL